MEANDLQKTPVKTTAADVAPDILFISGSPRSKTCVALIRLLEQGAKKAGAKTQTFLLSKKKINPCIGCGNCEKTGNCAFADKTKNGQFLDDYLELKAVLERVDAVAIVAPVYFAGPPAQLKALYDRMQPYWARRYVLGFPAPKKRPAQLFVVGSGEDAHGFAPLSGSTRSAMAVAGFNLEKVNNFIGFTAPKDMPKMPADALVTSGGGGEHLGGGGRSGDGSRERSGGSDGEPMSYADIAKLRRRISEQSDLVQRAQDAGSAFARFVVKKKQESEQASRETIPARTRISIPATVHAGASDDAQTSTKADARIGTRSGAQASAQIGIQSDAQAGKQPSSHAILQAEIDLKYSTLLSKTPHRRPEMAKAETDGDTRAVKAATASGTQAPAPADEARPVRSVRPEVPRADGNEDAVNASNGDA